MAPGKERVIAESPDRLATPSQPALVGAACLIAVVIVVVVQLLHLGQLMDAEQPITAGHAEGLVLAYALATVTIVVAAAALPLRLLWIPVASPALVTLTALAATLILGGELWSFVWALLTMGACWRAGSWLLGVAGASSLAREAAVAWLAGIGVLGISILLIGRAGLVAWWTVGAPILVLGVLGFTGMARSLGREGAHAAWSALTATRLTAGSAGLCLLISALAAVWVAAPELMFDALYHKSWLPGEWARTGEISPSTLHPVFNYSGLSQFIAVPGHLAGAEGVGRYLQWLAHGAGASGGLSAS
jgi:hypothetical protein